MSNTIKTAHGDILNTQNSIEETHNKNYPLVEMEKIEGTPFTLIHQEQKWFIVMGDHRVTEPTETKQQCLEKLEKEKWLLTMHIAIIAVQKTLEKNFPL